MTEARLKICEKTATWGGVIVTTAGIVYNISQGGDIAGAYISLSGVAVTCLGHWISAALAEHEKVARNADEQRIQELENIAYEANEIAKSPDLKRLIERERWDYIIEHQDDDR